MHGCHLTSGLRLAAFGCSYAWVGAQALRAFLANGDADRGLIFEDDFFPNGESLPQVSPVHDSSLHDVPLLPHLFPPLRAATGLRF